MTSKLASQPAGRVNLSLAKWFNGLLILVLLAAMAGVDFYAVQAWRGWQGMAGWPGTTGVIREFQAHHAGWRRDEVRYALDISYHYTVDSTTFAATNRMPGSFDSAFAACQAADTMRAKGSYLPVFYNPRDPADNVFSPRGPTGVWLYFGILILATVIGVVWFSRRLVRLASGLDDDALVQPVAQEESDDDLNPPVNLWQGALRWFFAGLGAASCWWMALTIYQDCGLPKDERTLPSADLIFMMEFILMHSGFMVPGVLNASSQARMAGSQRMLILALVYLTFAAAIAAAAGSWRLFVMFSGLMVSRWVGLLLDSNKARQQQMARSMETFSILILSFLAVFVLLRLGLDMAMVVYFCLTGLFEAILPARKRSLFPPLGS